MEDADLDKIILNRLKLIGIFCLPLFFYFVVKFLLIFNSISICLWKLIFNRECWGCGMTRAFGALFHGDFAQAYDFNPRIFIVAVIFIYLWLRMLVKGIQSYK